MIPIVTLGLIISTAFLVRYVKKNISIGNYISVLIAGIFIFLFQPFVHVLGSTEGGGAVQISSTIFGLYFIGWAVYKLIKFKKNINLVKKEENIDIKNQNIISNFQSIGILLSIITILVGGGYLGIKQYSKYKIEKSETQLRIEEQQKSLDDAKKEIEKLSIQSLETQKQQQDLTKQVSSKTDSQSKNLSISASEISKYIGGVMQISCGDSSGSISLWNSSEKDVPTYVGMTNAHVIEGVSGHCALFSGTDSEINIMSSVNPQEVYTWNNFADVAVLPIGNTFRPKDNCNGENCMETLSKDKLNYSISNLPECSPKMAVGSPVVTIGFPAFAMQENSYYGMTSSASHQIVSNGIISGYNNQDYSGNNLPFNNYYVSAKIDSGNSGGIALSKTSNGLCVLGIPTWVQVGNYETGGVVQNINNIMY